MTFYCTGKPQSVELAYDSGAPEVSMGGPKKKEKGEEKEKEAEKRKEEEKAKRKEKQLAAGVSWNGDGDGETRFVDGNGGAGDHRRQRGS